ncbi:DMT family transporter [Leptolyngbya sp. O-77]|uniref:DMT family transporter n=1 Tax=Leptolyngbya sp. O-77 TaxID=1080068 RepID=UPI0018D3A950|nr:DMT family transporter [Leptolyngbya sp. O-77]
MSNAEQNLEPQMTDLAASSASGSTDLEWQAATDSPVGRADPTDWQAAAALGLALFGISIGSIFSVAAGREMSPNAIALNRLIIAAIVFAALNGIQALCQPDLIPELRKTNPPKALDWLLLLAAGICFALSLVLLAWSFTQTSVAKASLFTHMMPLFTTLGAWLVLGRRFSRRFLIGMMVAVVGAIAIGIDDFGGGDNSLWGDAAALGVALLFATEILIMEQLRSRFAVSLLAMVECAIGSLLLLPTVLLQGESPLPPNGTSAAAVVGLALVTQMGGHGLITYSLKRFSAGVVSVVLLAVPIISAGLALVAFSQTISLMDAIAFAVVLTGIYLSITK